MQTGGNSRKNVLAVVCGGRMGELDEKKKKTPNKMCFDEGPLLSCHGLFALLSSQLVDGSKWGIIRA